MFFGFVRRCNMFLFSLQGLIHDTLQDDPVSFLVSPMQECFIYFLYDDIFYYNSLQDYLS